MSHAPSASAPVVTHAHWFGTAEQPTLGWLSASTSHPGPSGVLLLPPVGYEYWTTHRSLRTLAEELAQAGHLALRLDYTGTGDAAGNQWDADLLSRWQADVRAGVQALRERGATSITLIGLRVGGTLALNLAHEVGADAVVAWVPVTSGRRYVKEIQLLSMAAPDDVPTSAGPGARYLAGCVFSAELLAGLAALSTDAVQTTARVLVVDRPDKASSQKLVEALGNAGANVQHVVLDGADRMLDQPTEYATVPREHLSAIVDWCAAALSTRTRTGPLAALPAAQAVGHLRCEGRLITEREVTLGAPGLVGIESAPAQGPADATVVFLNTGSEPHVGPGRAWVELSRRLAAAGHRAIRVDFRGWGESPDEGHAPGRPYDLHTVDDTHTIVHALHARGDRRIVLVGLCAGAWVALHRCQTLPLAGLIAFNPQLYWQPGDPVFATIPEDMAWRQSETPNNPAWADAALRAVKTWLDDICRAPYPVDFWFSRNDQGILYIQQVLGGGALVGQAMGALTIRELPHLDHAMHLQWHRAEAFEALSAMLGRIAPAT